MKQKIEPYSKILPNSHKLRLLFNNKLKDKTYTHTEVLNEIMKVIVERESKNQFNDKITKEIYFTIMYDLLSNSFFKD